MGNCCGDKSSGNTNNTLIVSSTCQKIYQLGSSEMSKYDEVVKYCQELKELSHPNVKPLSSFTHHNDQLILNSHLHEDTDLSKYLDQKKNSILPSQNAKHIIRQICSGLQYLHSKNIVHGELNLKNVEINPSNNEIQIMNMNLSHKFKLTMMKSTSQMKEFESPEKQGDEILTSAADLYSLGVLGLSLYGVSFSTTLKVSKPIHCPFGLYEKLKALINQTVSARPPLDEIIDALDFETNPGSYNNIEGQDKEKSDNIKKSVQSKPNEDQYSIPSQRKTGKENELINENNINPQIQSNPMIQPSLVIDKNDKKDASNQAISIQNSKTDYQQQQPPSVQQLQPKSEKIIFKQQPEKIEYDFNPFSYKQGKDTHYINPKQRVQFFSDHEAKITSVIIDSNNKYVFTSSLDGSVIVYQFNTATKQLQEHKRLQDFTYGVSQILITRDNNYLIAADLSSNIYIYSLKDFKLFKKLTNLFEKSCILSIDISSDNKELLVAATYKTTLLYTLNNFEISQKQNIQGLSSNGNICRFFQNKIVIGEESGKILVFNKNNLITPEKELNNHNNAITQISIGKERFAVSSQDKNISLYDTTFSKIQNINSHIDCVSHVSISSDDSTLTSNGWDGSTCLYEKNASGNYELQSSFSNETSWSVSSVYIQKSKAIISTGGRFLFIFA